MKDDRRIDQLDPAMKESVSSDAHSMWHSPMDAPFGISGFPWIDRERLYRRLPAKPEWKIPPSVDSLANHTAGGQIRFRTDSRTLSVRVELKGLADMRHMPSTGQCGFDCYLGDHPKQTYLSTTMYDHLQISYECRLFEFPVRSMRSVLLNFPLYQGVKEVSIGLEADAEISAPLPYSLDGQIIFYGTSITHGGCATRPGMAYTNILSRRLNAECVNLGFSGSGRGEPELARLISQIERPACIVLDYESNAGGGVLEQTLRGFIGILREALPSVPILVLSLIIHARDLHFEAERVERMRLRDFQRDTVASFRDSGDVNLHFFDGSTLAGDAIHECTVDGSHPSDLGFYLMANGLEPVLRRIIFEGSTT